MVTGGIFLLFIINVKTFHGKSIMFNRRSMNIEPNSRSDTLYPKTQMSFETVQGSENYLETQIGSEIQTALDGSQVDPLDQLRQWKKTRRTRRTRRTMTKKTKRTTRTTTIPYTNTLKYLDTEATKKKLWITSLDPLRQMLAKKLPHFDPAPGQVGLLNKGIMYPVTQPLWIFEGYDDASSAVGIVREEYRTCESQKLRCMRDTDYNQPVCVVDLTMEERVPANVRNKGFHSQCEVEYRNCLKRYEIKGKYYADSYQEDYLEFLHYGWCQNCESFKNINCTESMNATVIQTIKPLML